MKCHCFYDGHCSHDCTLGFPSPKGYKTLTITDALAEKKLNKTSTKPAKPVSAIIIAIDSSNEEISATATVLPDLSGGYSSDSLEDTDVSHQDVSPPLCVRHLFWNCQIHGLINDFPVKIKELIDNGAHLILICPELVAELSLKKYHLLEPEIIDVALKNDDTKIRCKLLDYVKLSFTSLDCQWRSLPSPTYSIWIPVDSSEFQCQFCQAKLPGTMPSPVSLNSHWTASHFSESSPRPVDWKSSQSSVESTGILPVVLIVINY